MIKCCYWHQYCKTDTELWLLLLLLFFLNVFNYFSNSNPQTHIPYNIWINLWWDLSLCFIVFSDALLFIHGRGEGTKKTPLVLWKWFHWLCHVLCNHAPGENLGICVLLFFLFSFFIEGNWSHLMWLKHFVFNTEKLYVAVSQECNLLPEFFIHVSVMVKSAPD